MGGSYKSLSAVANAITGTNWNGICLFSALNARHLQIKMQPAAAQ